MKEKPIDKWVFFIGLTYKIKKLLEVERSLLQWLGLYGLILLAPASADANTRV